MIEIWKPVVGLEDAYEVSSQGNVKSISREYVINGGVYKKKPVLLKGSVSRNGYHRHTLSFLDKRVYKNTHRIVAEAFILNPENKPQINHKDGNKLNNSVSNLEWCDAKDNLNHAYRTGLAKGKAGIQNSMAVLSEQQVLEIVTLYRSGMKQVDIAKKFGQKFQNISCIVNGKSWSSITGIKLSTKIVGGHDPGEL